MRGWHIILGMAALSLGIIGIYDEYFTVVEFIKGFVQPLFAVIGFVAVLAGLLSVKQRTGHIVFGLVLLGVGIYGFFDEYYAVLDFFKGSVPIAMLLVGMISVASGVRQLK
jgi:UDP-N-acetylmuramyl pentapeptide phosphotransferase/UDP-N-acetylglucosamine-1-phosphate transferase